MTRRTFLASSAMIPVIKFPSDARHRLAVSTYPFRESIISPRKPGAGKLTLQQFASTISEKFNVFGIEPWSAHFASVESSYIEELAAHFKKESLRVVNIPCDVRVKFCGTPEERTTALETYHQWVNAAVTLGSPSIRVHCPAGKDPSDISCAVDGLKALAEYGASREIVINLENDNPASENPERILKVIEAAATPYLRSLPDFCNSMLIHDDQDYNERALTKLFPHAFNISHVKDVEFSNGKPLRVNIDRIFDIAKKVKYKGYFSMESESHQDPYESTKSLIAAAARNL